MTTTVPPQGAGASHVPGAPTVSMDRLFEAPLLRSVDAPSRERLTAVMQLRTVPADTVVYSEGDDADTLFVVAHGKVALRAVKRGDSAPSVIRHAAEFDSFGEESTLGLRRRSAATAEGPAVIVEFPASVFSRAAGRVGGSIIADREQRILARQVTADALRTMALSRDLGPADFDAVLDAATLRICVRGETIYGAGEDAACAFLIAEGLVQIQSSDPQTGATVVQAYLQPGDLTAEQGALSGEPHAHSAVSLGPSVVLSIPAAVLRSVCDRNSGLLGLVRRVAEDRAVIQQRVVGAAVERSTQHAFVDLYRMQMARSLLVIDQDTCVRCGHCAWSCAATHDGVARLIRRGDKVVTSLAVVKQPARSLLVPNSCQHCKNPACMVDCPTGAIGRDPGGDVFIREDLCTGCTACAKACPWDNIQMAPRSPAAGLSATVAVKCDLCRGYEAPACVEACPTGSLLRLDPHRDVAEVAALLGPPPGRGASPAREGPRVAGAWWGVAALAVVSAVLIGVGVGGAALQLRGVWVPGAAAGLAAGWLAAGTCLLALAYVVPKRIVALFRRRARSRGLRDKVEPSARPLPRSKLRPFMAAHIIIGSTALAGALAHGGLRTAGLAGALDVTFVLACALGVLGAFAYSVVPAQLTRLESDGALPEDLRRRGAELVDGLYKQISGRDSVVKRLVERVLLPYMRRPSGGIVLLASGRSLAQERRAVRGRIDAALGGHAQERLGGLDAAIKTAVERRALPVRRALLWVLRAWLLPHIMLSAVATVLLLGHIVVMFGWP